MKTIDVKERIAALEKYLAYYKFMKSHDIDPLGEINGIYKKTPLIKACNEIFPDVPVIFEEEVDKVPRFADSGAMLAPRLRLA